MWLIKQTVTYSLGRGASNEKCSYEYKKNIQVFIKQWFMEQL